MRMRKKKHSAERIEACSRILIKEPMECRTLLPQLFGNDKELFLELGCGKGDFANGLSRKYPNCGIVAVERVPDVAMTALEKSMADVEEREDNLRFIIGNAQYLEDWFAPGTFRRIYVNFCDPWCKKGYHKRRLTAPSYLEVYRKLLVPGGELRFKTDNEPLFDWSCDGFKEAGLEFTFYTRDLHASELAGENIVTEYESKFSSMGMNIYSAHVRFNERSGDDE